MKPGDTYDDVLRELDGRVRTQRHALWWLVFGQVVNTLTLIVLVVKG